MTNLMSIICEPESPEQCSQKIQNAINQGQWVQLTTKQKELDIIPEGLLQEGQGVIISSGGSTSTPHQCLLSIDQLNESAFATGEWLKEEQIDPKTCIVFNALPIQHVSGLMPLWRSCYWSSKHVFIKPSLMRNPNTLKEAFNTYFKKREEPKVISLVPTQVKRLLRDSDGIHWLKSFDVVWVGGSPLSDGVSFTARKHGIRLSPCYGTTETAAMITAQKPDDFLAGEMNVGSPLIDIEIQLGEKNRLQIRTPRLAKKIIKNGKVEPIKVENGWWDSGDIAELIPNADIYNLKIIGRIDTAIHSGGETVFPEHLQMRLLASAKKAFIPIQEILFIPIEDEEWGQRLIAIISFQGQINKIEQSNITSQVKELVANWPPSEQPVGWYQCSELKANELGKWDYKKWEAWLKTKRKNS